MIASFAFNCRQANNWTLAASFGSLAVALGMYFNNRKAATVLKELDFEATSIAMFSTTASRVCYSTEAERRQKDLLDNPF